MEWVILGLTKTFEHLEFIIPTLLTVYGFRLVYTEGNRLAKRNETYNLSQIARSVLESINKESEVIWSQNIQIIGDLDSAKLAAYVAEFEMCMMQIRAHYCDVEVSNRDIFSLRRLLTGGPYPYGNRHATNDERIKEIKMQISDISLKLLNSTYDNINKKFS